MRFVCKVDPRKRIIEKWKGCAVIAATMVTLICWARVAPADIVPNDPRLQSYYPLDDDFNDWIGSNHMTGFNKVTTEPGGVVPGGGQLRSDASLTDGSNSGASRVLGGAADFGITNEYTITAWYKLRDGNARNDLRGEKWPVGTGPRDFMFYNPDDGNEAFAGASYEDSFGLRTAKITKSAGLAMNNIPASIGGAPCSGGTGDCDGSPSMSDWYFVATRVQTDGTHQLFIGGQTGGLTEIHNAVLADYNGIGSAWDGNSIELGRLEQKADNNHGAPDDGDLLGSLFTDEVGIFNAALSDAAIRRIHGGGRSGEDLPSIPEPTSLVLLALASVAIFMRRRS